MVVQIVALFAQNAAELPMEIVFGDDATMETEFEWNEEVIPGYPLNQQENRQEETAKDKKNAASELRVSPQVKDEPLKKEISKEVESKNLIEKLEPVNPLPVTVIEEPAAAEIPLQNPIDTKPKKLENFTVTEDVTSDDTAVKQLKQPRPVAIMVENEPPARPQSGLWRADLVYEIVAEEITRFMPIYLQITGEIEIGPVRSARDYFADLSTIFDALYVHCGGSPRGLEFIRTNKLANINAIKGDRGFYRSRDRKIPHNLYIKLGRIPQEVRRKKYSDVTEVVFPYQFAKTPTKLETAECSFIEIPYYRSYRVLWKYLPELNQYRRFYKNKPFVSKDDGHFHDSANVIVHRISTKMIDNQMRHEMDLYSGGSCEVFLGGRRIEGLWQRDLAGLITYTDLEYSEIVFNPGKIWIQFVEPKLQLFYSKESRDAALQNKKGTKKRKKTKKK
jgi:hypothetical protein